MPLKVMLQKVILITANLKSIMLRRYILLFVLLLVVAVLAGFGYVKYRSYKAMTYQSDAKVAYETFVAGDYKNSADQLPALIAQAPNKSEVGRLKILLAVSYWYRNQNNDSAQAVKVLKEVVNDYSIPAAWRAQALNSLARFVQDSSLSFYQLHFSEAPYNTFVPAEGTEAQKLGAVYLALLKYSDDTYPTSWAEYAIAYHYASSNLNNPDLNLKDIGQTISKYVQDGDSRKDEYIYAPSVLVQGYQYRAFALARSATFLGSTADLKKKAEVAYQLLFDTATRLGQEDKMSEKWLDTLLYQAKLLSTQKGAELSQLSNEIYPTPLAKYTLAGGYYTPLVYFGKAGSESSTEMAKKIQSLIKEGDSIKDSSSYPPYLQVYAYLYRALAVYMTGEVLKDSTLAQREEAFKYVLTTAAKAPGASDEKYAALTLRARFYYAGLLLLPVPERKADLVALLAPFSQTQLTAMDRTGFFSAMKKRPNDHPHKIMALKLAEISPDFKKFFESL